MNIDLCNWMGSIDSERKLYSLNIPGAHDCAANRIQFSRITKCQNRNIGELLSIGVRAFDVRVTLKDGRLKCVHRIAKIMSDTGEYGEDMDLGEILSCFYGFLEKNPGETVILQFKDDTDRKRIESYDCLYEKYIKPDKDKWFLENRVPLLGEVRGRIVLIRRNKADFDNREFTRYTAGLDFSSWAEQKEKIPVFYVLKTHSSDDAQFLIQDRYRYNAKKRWSECIKPFLDRRRAFDGRYIVCFLSTAGGLGGPEGNAAYINRQFISYPLEKGKYYGIVYTDFADEALAEKIAETNF